MPDHRLLIIDDDTRLAEMLTEYLAPEGLELTSVPSGIQGLRSAQRENFDLIILDVMLPGLSGFDVLKQLREAGIRTPVLMLTARGDDVDRIVGLDFESLGSEVLGDEVTELYVVVDDEHAFHRHSLRGILLCARRWLL